MRKVVVCTGIGLALVLSNAAGAAAKPAPSLLDVRAGTIVTSNVGIKAGVPALPVSAAAAKGAPTSVVPNLAGYSIVSASFSNPNGAQNAGSVTCPSRTVALGGGTIGSSVSVFQNVNGSVPLVSGSVAVGWVAWMDNTSGSDSSFTVYAVCAKKPRVYAVVSVGFASTALIQSTASVQCPIAATGKRMKILGGGGIGGATSPGEDINSSIPQGSTVRAWRVDMNNRFASDQSATVYAVCGNRKGWRVTVGPDVLNAAGTQTFANAVCPSGYTTISGGVLSNSGSTQINLNATFPGSAAEWDNFENNAASFNDTLTPFAVCVL